MGDECCHLLCLVRFVWFLLLAKYHACFRMDRYLFYRMVITQLPDPMMVATASAHRLSQTMFLPALTRKSVFVW